MFERFTDRARRVVVLAQEEALLLKHNYIGTEHILLGMTHPGEEQSKHGWPWPVRIGRRQVASETSPVAAAALENLGISLQAVRHQVEEITGQGQQAPSGHFPFTPRVKKVFELSFREANKLGNKHIGTGHLLLGLVREGNGMAAHVLVQLGADLPTVRQQVMQQLSPYAGGEEGTTAAEREEELELPDVELMAHAPSAASDQTEQIHALSRDIVERLDRIERHLTDGDDTP